MPLQNRVTPFGEILAIEGRGAIMGNRGSLCEVPGRLKRQWETRRWIACLIDFRGRRRAVMQARVWTALFFLDEASAFSAGHRPCAYCRRDDYKRFRGLWIACHGEPADANSMDAVLDRERREGRIKRTYRSEIGELPAGSFVSVDGAAWLVTKHELARWSMQGYQERRSRPKRGEVEVLTPPSMVALIKAGYAPLTALRSALDNT